MYQPRPSQEERIYKLLEERKALGISCTEFVPLLGITQPNPRVKSLRDKYGCTCKHTHGKISETCTAVQHFVNDGHKTYLIQGKAQQLYFV